MRMTRINIIAKPWASALALILMAPTAAYAQSAQGQVAQSQYSAPTATQKRDWSLQLAAGASYQPEYEGSDEYKVSFLPVVAVSYRDLVFLRGPMLGVNVFTVQGAGPGDKLQVGPLLRYQFGRDEDDSDDLHGMGDIDASLEVGGFVNYSTGPWSAGLTVFRDVGNSYDGMTARLSAGNQLPLRSRLMLRSEIFTTWANDNYTEAFFGVTAAQSARSGMRQYDPDGGFKDVGFGFDLSYTLLKNWELSGRLGYKRLLGDAADSPLVEDRGSADQVTTGLLLKYKL